MQKNVQNPEAESAPASPAENNAAVQAQNPGSKSENSADPEKESPAAVEEDQSIHGLISTLVAEAEQRGYLRARNEIAQAVMNRPRLWENPLRTAAAARRQSPAGNVGEPEAEMEFLNRERPRIWD